MTEPRRGIPIDELDEATRRKLNIAVDLAALSVAPRVPVLGKVLAALKGLSISDAIWVMEKARDNLYGNAPPTAKEISPVELAI